MTKTTPIVSLAFLVPALSMAAGSAHAAVRYVNASAATLGDGSSWATAMPHLVDALAVAQTGDEVWVAGGTYYPDTSGGAPSGTGNRTSSFMMKSGVRIYGGFAGTETSRIQRNPALNLTVLSGDIGVRNVHNDNSYNVVEASGVSSEGVLDGFTIKRGTADGVTTIDTYVGGGAYVYNGGKPTFSNCRFEDHWGRGGAGLSAQGASAIVSNCVFIRCIGAVRSGGIEFTASPNAVVSNCLFDTNSGPYGGGIYLNEGSSGAIVENCTFVDNDSVNGGGMFLAGFSASTVRNCRFLRNECKQLGAFQTSFDGGAVKNWCTSSVFINCLFNGNSAIGTGGAVLDAGPSGSNATLINCTIYGNYSRDGGAVGAIMGHTPQLKNSIVWGNTASAANPPSLVGGVVVTSSNVQGMTTLTLGNSNVDPQFVAPTGNDGTPATSDDNFRLLSSSPLIDAGDNTLVPAEVLLDIEGSPRQIDGDQNGSVIVDMGAFEFLPPPPPHCYGDADGNRIVNFADITKILSSWGGAGPEGDSDDSGIVNFADITATLTAWGADCNPA